MFDQIYREHLQLGDGATSGEECNVLINDFGILYTVCVNRRSAQWLGIEDVSAVSALPTERGKCNARHLGIDPAGSMGYPVRAEFCLFEAVEFSARS